MTEFTTITRKGQITIPAPIRRALNLQIGDLVAVTRTGRSISLSPAQGVVARTAGMLKSPLPPLSAEAERDLAMQAIAEAVANQDC